MNSWHGYPKVWNLGHPNLTRLFDGEVLVEEKLDGSQWSFGAFGGELRMKTHHKERSYPVDEKMFKQAADEVYRLFVGGMLTDGYTYRTEAITSPKHNALLYGRIPRSGMVLYDVEVDYCAFAGKEDRSAEAERLGLETPTVYFHGPGSAIDLTFLANALLEPPMLGGVRVEGVVIKNYSQFGEDGKVLMGKHVCEAFREINAKAQRASNPSQGDIVSRLIETYRTEQRWEKAALHLRERGELASDPRDIGLLIREAQSDTIEECREEIAEALLGWAIPKVKRGITSGLAEWYKQKLLEKQFGGGEQ